ncbi:MAG: tRNA (adenosine(37)-N6)-threonylcarbamoyltransferase complex dimerization subunit type 1 TsaB [Armatimonadota bacterium]
MSAILAIETSGEPASLAVIRDGDVVADLHFAAQRRLSQVLMLRVDDVLKCAGVSLREVTALAASLGPGSFTGLRIGIGTAKALAQVNRCDIVGVPTHHAIAERHAPTSAGLACVVTIARADEVYATLLRRGENAWREVAPCRVYRVADLKEFLDKVGEKPVLCGDGAAAWLDDLGRVGEVVAADDLASAASRGAGYAPEIGLIAHRRLRSGATDDPDAVRPLYVRPSQAEAARGLDLGLSR